jgi:hypothetical protein
MLNQTSRTFRKLFLLEFTKQLIDAYSPEDIAKLEKILKYETSKADEKKKELEQIEEKKEKKELLELTDTERIKIRPKRPDLRRSLESLKKMKPVLIIPETRLPHTFQYLRPAPTGKEIDLGILNDFIKDPSVKVIECAGPNENLIVHGVMGRKLTNVILKKEEVDNIIKKFADTAKIPIDQGVFKAVFGNLILSAIISETVGAKFVLRKMPSPQRRY